MTGSKQLTMSVAFSKRRKTHKILKLLVSTPEIPGNSEEHTFIQQRIFCELKTLQDSETLDTTKDVESRTKFLNNSHWKDSPFALDEIARIL